MLPTKRALLMVVNPDLYISKQQWIETGRNTASGW